MTFLGELAALSAAFLWAIASLVYAQLGQTVAPLLLNLGKGGVAIALLVLTLYLTGAEWPTLSTAAFLAMSGSGVVGIAIGDTLYIEALRCLGARLTLLLGILAPPLTLLGDWLLLKETPSPWQGLGVALTLAGVIWVIRERTAVTGSRTAWGIGCGVAAALTNAGGALLARSALTGSDLSPLWGALLRLGAAQVVLLLWVITQQQINWRSLGSLAMGRSLIVAAFLGTYLGIWLQQTGLKYTSAGIAQTLSTTSPLFILLIAALSGRAVTLRSWLGSGLAIAGVSLLFLPL